MPGSNLCRLTVVSLLLTVGIAPARQQSSAAEVKENTDAEAFSSAIAKRLLNDVRAGLEAQNQRLILSAFDPDKMAGYADFQNQIAALFTQYESFRMYFRVLQSTPDGPKGVALVEVQLEEVPRGATSPPIRKNGELRLEFEAGRNGWKIVGISPRKFFS
jgi:hypothetical protein